jgi:3-oxoadipate enol-lactonase
MSLKPLTTAAEGRLWYADFGPRQSDNVAVLVHAFPTGVRMWEHQVSARPAAWRFVLPALEGFDGSPSEKLANPAIDDYARDLLLLLDTLHIERAVVGGVSMGGYVAFAVVRLASPRVRALILADTRSAPDTDEARASRRKLLERLEREGPRGVADDMLPKLLGKTTLATRPEVVASVRAMIESQSKLAIAAAIHRLMWRPDSTPLLATVRVPAVVIVGEEDGLTPPSESEAMRARLRDATLETIPRAGHLSNIENPAAFNEALGRFLDRLHEPSREG